MGFFGYQWFTFGKSGSIFKFGAPDPDEAQHFQDVRRRNLCAQKYSRTMSQIDSPPGSPARS
jgi:hypothetical protein